MASDADLYLYSSPREGLLEHLFVGDVMRALWLRGHRDIEVLRPVTDAAGYDVVIGTGGVTRYIQLKSSTREGRTARQKINIALAGHSSGCVIWMRFDPAELALGPFAWFGGSPGAPLPDLGETVARHTRGNATGHKAERPMQRVLTKGRFENGLSLGQIVDRLFGAHHVG